MDSKAREREREKDGENIKQKKYHTLIPLTYVNGTQNHEKRYLPNAVWRHRNKRNQLMRVKPHHLVPQPILPLLQHKLPKSLSIDDSRVCKAAEKVGTESEKFLYLECLLVASNIWLAQ